MSEFERYFGLIVDTECEYARGIVVPAQSSGKNLSRDKFALRPQFAVSARDPNLASRVWK